MVSIIAIDPGLNGGIVVFTEEGNILAPYTMPQVTGPRGGKAKVTDWAQVAHVLRIHADVGDWLVAVEKPAMMSMGRGGAATAKGMERMLMDYGRLLGVIEAAGLPFREVAPQSWQAHYNLNTGLPRAGKKATDKERLAMARDRRHVRETRMTAIANGLWPAAAKTYCNHWHSGTIAAALIGRYVREGITNGVLSA